MERCIKHTKFYDRHNFILCIHIGKISCMMCIVYHICICYILAIKFYFQIKVVNTFFERFILIIFKICM